ncbi:MAG: MerR family transcriptional regulator [Defluviitaleaceae bacterium]|nr:MerR family transcriptional regulator [Defluviitaleaceae bacterium]
MDNLTKVRDVSTRYDISARALKYYEDAGLLTSTRTNDYAYRMYDETAVMRLEQILILRKLNISIKDIKRIFDTAGSDALLDVLGKKADHIDEEVALLHELKEIVLDFMQEIKQLNFSDNADVKQLYDKAKDIESKLISVDYIGKPANINRLIETAEKVAPAPKFRVFTRELDAFQFIGVKHTYTNNMGEVYEKLDSEENQPLRDIIKKHAKPGNREIGIEYAIPNHPTPNEGPWEIIGGGIVDHVTEIPDGASIMHFPASEFLVVTHEWVYTTDEAFPLIGKSATYAHSDEVKNLIPEGYERYNDPIVFIDWFNYKYEENEYRHETWFPIRKK